MSEDDRDVLESVIDDVRRLMELAERIPDEGAKATARVAGFLAVKKIQAVIGGPEAIDEGQAKCA